MKLQAYALVLTVVFVQPAYAAIENEIASMDRSMVRACEVAETNAIRAKQSAIESFLRVLSLLERQYTNARDEDALLACRKERAKYDPGTEKVDQPTEKPDQLRALVSGLERQLTNFDRHKTSVIADAQNRRVRNLTALHNGLVKRGDTAGAKLVAEALKSTPTVPKPADPATVPVPESTPAERNAIAPKDVVYLTYNRARNRWEEMDGEAVKGIRREVAEETTTLHYEVGNHALLKVLWPNILEVGDRFSVELKGAASIEMVDLNGADANARTSLPTADSFVKVEITREQDRITYICNGEPQKTFYASGKLRGDDAKSVLVARILRAGFAVKKGEQASFRNATITKP